MVRPKKHFNVDIDAKILTIKTQKEEMGEVLEEQSIVDKLYMPIMNDKSIKNITIHHVLLVLNQQMKLNGLRKRTIEDYHYQFKRFAEMVKVEYIHEINADKIYEYLSILGDIKDISKLNRLKTLTAILGRCYDNGWIKSKYWKNIKIKVDKSIKQPSNERELSILLSILDKATYSGFRDSVAVLLLYKTGIRITTLGLLEEKHIDFNNQALCLTGDIMKSHKALKLPLDDDMCSLLHQLIEVNREMRREYKEKNTNIFLTSTATPIKNTVSPSNLIAKNLYKYSKRYGLKNINAHSIRRLYAQNLIKRGANINLVSHALGHDSLHTTSRYLYLDEETVAKNLRDYL
ncbi:site-specific integrase [Lysinibacillus sp. CD3-6]|uniref:tyrosine-type recombinase/integrase n=1 Tax=Lysinibacillus sp. CD3-6 TaxID=2892541 RepID=UPI001D175828|nr:site-specific integrase [Lysinibacillus sp. CD3-6]UED79294.1 site-specific integrase [Lysinibacillus sp. CD3-6]